MRRRRDAAPGVLVPPAAGRPPAEVLAGLELTVQRRLDGLLHGDHRGLVAGHGSEADEARPYIAGDDVRRIDWNVTARMRQPYTRETVADRELESWLVLDLSPSLDFGTARCTKRDLAISGAAAIAFLAARDGNRLGAVLLDGSGTHGMPARSGRDHLRAVLHRALTAPSAEGPVDLAPALRRLTRPGHRRGLVVLVSDLLAPDGWQRALRAVAARHEVLVLEVVDPRELELPAVGDLALVDPETGRTRTVRTTPKLRRRYAEAAADQRAELAADLRALGADHLQLRTDRDWVLDVVRFVRLRRARAVHARKAAP
jgi:uncharacterized protein (DUF58 family)